MARRGGPRAVLPRRAGQSVAQHEVIDYRSSPRSDLTCVLSWNSRAETSKRTGPHSLRSPQISRFALMSRRCWVCKQVGRYRCTRGCAAPNLPNVLPIRARWALKGTASPPCGGSRGARRRASARCVGRQAGALRRAGAASGVGRSGGLVPSFTGCRPRSSSVDALSTRASSVRSGPGGCASSCS